MRTQASTWGEFFLQWRKCWGNVCWGWWFHPYGPNHILRMVVEPLILWVLEVLGHPLLIIWEYDDGCLGHRGKIQIFSPSARKNQGCFTCQVVGNLEGTANSLFFLADFFQVLYLSFREAKKQTAYYCIPHIFSERVSWFVGIVFDSRDPSRTTKTTRTKWRRQRRCRKYLT